MEGFLRKTGLTQDQLVEREGVYFAVVEKPGRNTADVLAEAIPAIIRAFPWPKSQRWGAASAAPKSCAGCGLCRGSLRCWVMMWSIAKLMASSAARNQRATASTTQANYHRQCRRLCRKTTRRHVIVHFSERARDHPRRRKSGGEAAGLVLVEDEGLVTENAGLTEWPVPMLGRFDPAFLAVPQEVIQLTARVNQKYFVCNESLLRGDFRKRGFSRKRSPTKSSPKFSAGTRQRLCLHREYRRA